jgi:hypothetical protein
MKHSTMRRSSIAGLVAATIAVLAPGIAQAEPPSNDDFDSATAVAALPFHATENTAEATRAPDDPPTCYDFADNSVWFRYTAPADAVVHVLAESLDYTTLYTVFTGTRGQLVPVPGVCAFGSTGGGETFHVTAGTTYYLLVRSYFGGGGALTVDLEALPPSPNDDFAGATAVTALPSTFTGDLARAGRQPDEPLPSCDATATDSVWYVYRPQATRSVAAHASSFLFSPTVTVYRGTALTDLTEVDCALGSFAVFGATAGEAYYIRVANDPEGADPFEVQLDRAPDLHPGIATSAFQPSIFDEILFHPFTGDAIGTEFASGELRFGDGSSAPFTGDLLRHQYAADGVYQLEFTGATRDGRTGTATASLRIETHDVSIASLTVPARARVDQTKPISVSIANTRQDETVQVELFKQTGGGSFVHVGTLTQWVPARPDRTLTFPFAYTFGAADATAGAVTFKAVATVPFATRDARPADNERLATTTVR